ncbi:FAS1 domain-containing protein [Gorgonomyces haynaldii]|nr:FAS1 domain-containing protein [Gorgonomyces haynaldii]
MFFFGVQALLISDYIRQDPTLSKAQQVIASNPKWSDPTAKLSVFVPTDDVITAAGLPANDPGCATVERLLNYTNATEPNYVVVQSDKGIWFVFDNYTPGSLTPTIHVRTGLADGLAPKQFIADNGFLYVTSIVIGPPATLAQSLPAQGSSLFLKAIQDAGLLPTLEAARNLTIFCPSDAAFTAASAQFNALTASQKKAVLLYHMSSTFARSTAFSATLPSLLGPNLTLSLSGEKTTIDGKVAVTVADNYCQAGFLQRVDGVLIPSILPGPNDPVNPVGITAVPTTTVAPKPTQVGSNPATISSSPNQNAAELVAPLWSMILAFAF